MGRKRTVKVIPLEERRKTFIDLSETYWDYYFRNKNLGDQTCSVMRNLLKMDRQRKKVAISDPFEENRLSLREMRIIDNEIKCELRNRYE
ncbi:MAG: hypothetical protein ACUZ8I_04520 [Candidatus Scalindua sp.]